MSKNFMVNPIDPIIQEDPFNNNINNHMVPDIHNENPWNDFSDDPWDGIIPKPNEELPFPIIEEDLMKEIIKKIKKKKKEDDKKKPIGPGPVCK